MCAVPRCWFLCTSPHTLHEDVERSEPVHATCAQTGRAPHSVSSRGWSGGEAGALPLRVKERTGSVVTAQCRAGDEAGLAAGARSPAVTRSAGVDVRVLRLASGLGGEGSTDSQAEDNEKGETGPLHGSLFPSVF